MFSFPSINKKFQAFSDCFLFKVQIYPILVNENYSYSCLYLLLISSWSLGWQHIPIMDKYTFISQLILWRLSKKDFGKFISLLEKDFKIKFFHSMFERATNNTIV